MLIAKGYHGMDNFTKEMVDYRLNCAKEDLGEAINGLSRKSLRVSANRAYYSIFHSMRTILALEQKDFKKHSAVLAYFNQNYIKAGIFPSNLFELIRNASLIRDLSDYMDLYVASFDKIKEQVESAKLIFDLVEKYINNLNKSGEK